MIIATQPQLIAPPRAKKEMLSISEETFTELEDSVSVTRRRTVVRINNSSLDLINTCKRKAYYALEKELISKEENAATLFGTAVHKGLETWYSAPRSSRKPLQQDCDATLLDNNGARHCARCAGIAAFRAVAAPLETLELTDKRHPYNGVRLLNTYFDKYLTDPFEILCDESGRPYTERRFEFTLYEDRTLKIIVFGTIDAILRNIESGVTLVCDHKTTSSLGSEFYQRIRPNHQYTLYIMGTQRVFGLETDLFLVNGLQVARTKADCARQITQRTQEDFDEVTAAIVGAVRAYLACRESGVWPQSAPGPCSNYGGCPYRTLCEVPLALRANVIEALYGSPTEKEIPAHV